MPAPVSLLSKLLWIRDAAALPDHALAALLDEETRVLVTLVNAHPGRFAEEMVFRLTAEERSRIPDAPVLAFTEAGTALLVGLLPGHDDRILALLPRFAEARHLLTAQAELAARVAALEEKLEMLATALQGEVEDEEKRRPIGFIQEELPPGQKAKHRRGQTKA